MAFASQPQSNGILHKLQGIQSLEKYRRMKEMEANMLRSEWLRHEQQQQQQQQQHHQQQHHQQQQWQQQQQQQPHQRQQQLDELLKQQQQQLEQQLLKQELSQQEQQQQQRQQQERDEVPQATSLSKIRSVGEDLGDWFSEWEFNRGLPTFSEDRIWAEERRCSQRLEEEVLKLRSHLEEQRLLSSQRQQQVTKLEEEFFLLRSERCQCCDYRVKQCQDLLRSLGAAVCAVAIAAAEAEVTFEGDYSEEHECRMSTGLGKQVAEALVSVSHLSSNLEDLRFALAHLEVSDSTPF
eukprot:TRINITY_DN10357_c1_g1_i1.p1 TRINITY_DN10357_c1_g1~~TRINITY_DN10357_c1_g1_i1.p1  ORF type:complete len:314 (+),score=88.98 TRINITY_DN10357_c1_g1_i1:62-943(+)